MSLHCYRECCWNGFVQPPLLYYLELKVFQTKVYTKSLTLKEPLFYRRVLPDTRRTLKWIDINLKNLFRKLTNFSQSFQENTIMINICYSYSQIAFLQKYQSVKRYNQYVEQTILNQTIKGQYVLNVEKSTVTYINQLYYIQNLLVKYFLIYLRITQQLCYYIVAWSSVNLVRQLILYHFIVLQIGSFFFQPLLLLLPTDLLNYQLDPSFPAVNSLNDTSLQFRVQLFKITCCLITKCFS